MPFCAKTLGARTVCPPAGMESCPMIRTIVVASPIKKFSGYFSLSCSYRFPLYFQNNRVQHAEIREIHLFSIGFHKRTVLCRLLFKGCSAQGTVQQFHHRPVTEREFLIINPAAKMKNLRPVKQFCRKLPLKRCSNVFSVSRLVWVGQAHGGDDQRLPAMKRKSPQGFRKAQDAAGIQSAQIDDSLYA